MLHKVTILGGWCDCCRKKKKTGHFNFSCLANTPDPWST